ncbi:ADP-ribosylglycohydrolase family protein [Acanthopleuribacter pedis]|uniref:ADP-ribosylglycohydrolase family protein n=1 Tax=Acanthopleuribacter pedis TaxID=442870 RepID=A0A8J7QCM5_9BACT|nr:ADP-ribosylglycohydrolase family protein [Acanthopleuribacter pedis]MBO1317105.1 ADP-ribosylglycohydrolase family protein [Acanthopleuribacter pedis]
MLVDRGVGCLLGGAVGDALGLPFETLSARRIAKWFRPGGYQLFFGRGMVSDDTEHSFLVLKVLHLSQGDPVRFQRLLRRALMLWLLALPTGIGFATLRALLKSWLGLPVRWAAVNSPGSGPAMRAAVIGCYAARFPERADVDALTRAATEMTHANRKAEIGALAMARLARMAALSNTMPGWQEVRAELQAVGGDDPDWVRLIALIEAGLEQQLPVPDFAVTIGHRRRQGGYVYFTTPLAIYSWLRHPGDLIETVAAVIRCGGDTDTGAAMAGGLAGASLGEAGIPAHYLETLCDQPLSVSRLRRTAAQAFGTGPASGLGLLFFPLLMLRNLSFLTLIVAHLFRRLLPPY